MKIENIKSCNHSFSKTINQSTTNHKFRQQQHSQAIKSSSTKQDAVEYDEKKSENASNCAVKTEQTDSSNLSSLSLDELLQKALTFWPNLRWNEDNEWCRYCGFVSFSSSYFPHILVFYQTEPEHRTHSMTVQWV